MTLWLGITQGLDNLTNFCIQKHCDSGVTIVLVCHMILQDLVNKVSCDFIGWIPLKQDAVQQDLVAITTVVVEL